MGIKVLSLFDGISCGQVALDKLGVEVDKYYAYEIDDAAIQVTQYNYPNTIQGGDVYKEDFTKYTDCDLLIGGSPCFTEGNLVLTKEGYKDIKDVEIGDYVLTHMNRYRKVIRKYINESPTVDIKITGYPQFTTTENHPFYTIQKHKTNHRFFDKVSDWTKVKDLTNNHFCGQNITKNKNINPHNLTKEDCWILGRYIADGHIRKDKRKNSYHYGVILSIGKDKVEDIKKKNIKRNHSLYKHTSSCYRCVFSSKELVDFIIDNNFGRGAANKRIPELIFDLPNELAEEFLNGYMSGDGHYCKNSNSYQASTISKELAYDLQRLITRIYETNVSVMVSKSRKNSYIDGREIKNINPTYTVQYKKGIRKQSVAYKQDNKIWTQFKYTNPTNKIETVYNIQVEEDESYTINNIIVHNCTYWSIAKAGDNRETTSSGIGFDLFMQYVRALKESKVKYFLYENNASISKEIQKEISRKLGVESIEINSAIFSAQDRKRLYWTNIPHELIIPELIGKNFSEESNLVFKDIEYPHDYREISFEKYKDTTKINYDNTIIYWDTSGKGNYSQQSRARKNSIKMNTVPASGTDKNNVWLGEYTYRKIHPIEAERLQTLPDDYTSCLKSKTKRISCCGNGWTVDVIAFLLSFLFKE